LGFGVSDLVFGVWVLKLRVKGIGFRVEGPGFRVRCRVFRVNGVGERVGGAERRRLARGGLVFKAHRLVYHSTLGSRVIKKKKKLA